MSNLDHIYHIQGQILQKTFNMFVMGQIHLQIIFWVKLFSLYSIFFSETKYCIYLFKEILVCSSRHKHQIGYSSNSMSLIFKGF